MAEKTQKLKQKLRHFGLSKEVVQAAWPEWWSDEAEFSPSAFNELRFSLSRKLGITPSSLIEEEEPQFTWYGDAKFKGLKANTQLEKDALISFGTSISRLLLKTIDQPYPLPLGMPPSELRAMFFESGALFIGLPQLLALSWALGIPIIHLRLFPLPSKRMEAMTLQTMSRYVILIGKDAIYPAQIAYYIAHELGHIFKGHLAENMAIIDNEIFKKGSRDTEELEADEFALALLTGSSNPQISPTRAPKNSAELARAALSAAQEYRIEPGTLVLCYAHATKSWRLAQAALKYVYNNPKPVWREVNQYAFSQLNAKELTADNFSFLCSVMGSRPNGSNTDR